MSKKIDEQKLHVKLWLRASDAPMLPVNPNWRDLRLQDYESGTGILPLPEFGSIESVFTWVNEGKRHARLGMTRKFGPFDVLAASLNVDGVVKVTAFICELPGNPIGDEKRLVIVSGKIICTKIPSNTKFVTDLADEFFT